MYRADEDAGRSDGSDFRTLLEATLMVLEQALAGDLAPAERGRAQSVIDAGRAMLAAQRGERPVGVRSAPGFTPVAIGEKVRDCVEAMRQEAESKGLVVRCAVDRDLPRLAYLDPLRLRQVLLSLIGSAIASTESGWISVCAEPAWNDPATIAISVTDTGDADRHTNAEDKLALTICCELALLIGGTVSRTCEPDRGARAELRIPLIEMPGGAHAYATLAPVHDRRRDAPRILVVDGLEVARTSILDQIARLGARATALSSGKTALARVLDAQDIGDPFRLVLLDLATPGANGLATARRLRACGHPAHSLPIVALTSDGSASTLAACIAAGMQGHLAKPVALESLRYVIDRWIPDPNAPEVGSHGGPLAERRQWSPAGTSA